MAGTLAYLLLTLWALVALTTTVGWFVLSTLQPRRGRRALHRGVATINSDRR